MSTETHGGSAPISPCHSNRVGGARGVDRYGMLPCTRSERAAAAVTALLLLHHGEWCAWHVLAVTGRLVGAGEAAVAAWSRSRT